MVCSSLQTNCSDCYRYSFNTLLWWYLKLDPDEVGRQDQGEEDQQPGLVRRQPPQEQHGGGGWLRRRWSCSLSGTRTKQVCTEFAPIMFCEISVFAPCLTKVCSLKTSILSLHWANFRAFWFALNFHKFAQFALILHRIYTEFTSQPAFFLGKKAGWEICKLSVIFEQTVQTLSKQTCIYPCKFAQCKRFWPSVNNRA